MYRQSRQYQTPYRKNVETTTTYARAAIPEAPIEEAALCQRAVPSKMSDNPSSGTGAATLDQTRSEKGRCGRVARVTTFPQPHDAADAIPSTTACRGTPCARPATMAPTPATASVTPAT